MVTIDNRYYYIDIEAIYEFIFKKQVEGESETEIPISEVTYDGDGRPVQTIQTFKGDSDKIHSDIRYDMVKTMLEFIYSSGIERGVDNDKYNQDIDSSNIGTKLIYNTLIKQGFLKNNLD